MKATVAVLFLAITAGAAWAGDEPDQRFDFRKEMYSTFSAKLTRENPRGEIVGESDGLPEPVDMGQVVRCLKQHPGNPFCVPPGMTNGETIKLMEQTK